MNKINTKKFLKSKWTATKPKHKEKPFIISEVEFDEEGLIILCCIQAVMTKRSVSIDWTDLKDDNHWLHGWK
jgi:tryptophan-rich hypothetical protein